MGLQKDGMQMSHVLIVTDDTLAPAMAGPAIRAFEIAGALSRIAQVTLASTVPVSLSDNRFEIVEVSRKSLKRLVEWADLVIFQGALLSTEPWINKTNKVLVADIYDPMHLEVLEQLKNIDQGQRYLETLDIASVMNEQLLRADFFICASEKQRDFWLGQLAALGRLNPGTYDSDSSLRNLIGIVPFGVENEPPVQTKHAIKGLVPGISEQDKVIIWGGGIYNWFDPLTLIRAVAQLSQHHSDLRLFFLGTQHPNPHVPEMRMSFQARELSEELGVLGTHVFFNEGWVDYKERSNYLLDADLGVSTHLDHLETAFSFRTRILDYLWCGLPIVATKGDTFEAIIDGHGLGRTVHPGDIDELANALGELLYDDAALAKASENSRNFAKSLTWDLVTQPLIDIAINPVRSADSGTKFAERLKVFAHLGRRSLRQRAWMFGLSSKLISPTYTAKLFLKNSFRKIRRTLKIGN